METKSLFQSPVYPITPAYHPDGRPDWERTAEYIRYLDKAGAKVIMTTAGTSQFNLLTPEEILELNVLCREHFSGHTIMGLAPSASVTTAKEIEKLNAHNFNNVSLLLLFPDRYYNGSEVRNFFTTAADRSHYPVLFHGNPIRKGTGGQFEYNAEMVNALAAHPNIIGMKEEASQFTGGYLLCKDIEDEGFATIVAGGSMRRYWMLHVTGATTFLTGLGSLWPTLAEVFFRASQEGDLELCKYIINAYENPFFDVFMKIGWHPAFREGLRVKGLCGHDRPPFVQLTEDQKRTVKNIIERIETQLQNDKRLDIRTV